MSADNASKNELSPLQNEAGNRELIVDEDFDQARLDQFLAARVDGISRVKIQAVIRRKQVWVDGATGKPSLRLSTGQVVKLVVPDMEPDTTIPENIPLDILFEDDVIVVVNKPANMVVHPARGHWAGTLVAALAYHFSELSTIGGATRPGIVHRLDRDTSGVILIAKSDEVHANITQQFERRTVSKEYGAIVSPAPDRDRDWIDRPIGVHPYQREKMAIREDHERSRPATTMYEVVERVGGFAWVVMKPETGRTHQLRVHMASIGCPILADKLYSGRSRLTLEELTRNSEDKGTVIERQALHARMLSIDHPKTGERMTFEAPIASDILNAFELIKRHRS
ncbi:MAG: RluA family pseudouridine synthase [Pirellulaceae bacterium]